MGFVRGFVKRKFRGDYELVDPSAACRSHSRASPSLPPRPSTSTTTNLLTLIHLTTMSISIAGDTDERHRLQPSSSSGDQSRGSLEAAGLACEAQPASRPSDVVSHSSRCAILPTSRSKRCRQSWTRSHHGWLCCHVTPSRVVHGRRCPLSPFCPTVCRCGGADGSLCCAWRAPLEERRTGGRPQRPRGQALRHVDA